MAYILNLTTHSDNRGNLTVIENQIPFPIKRIFYIYLAFFFSNTTLQRLNITLLRTINSSAYIDNNTPHSGKILLVKINSAIVLLIKFTPSADGWI